jgi:hypothetical protein
MLSALYQALREKGLPLEIKINNNRHTLLSVRRRPRKTCLSLHHIFLDAPRDVIEAIALYVQGGKKRLSPIVRAFIETRRAALDYSHIVEPQKLSPQGRVYNLGVIFNELNETYFGGSQKLHITWFGSIDPKHRTRATLGLYYDTLRLIKIHRLLDTKSVPRYVLEFVVYHEMVHAIYPSYINEKGISRSHDRAFHEREKQFRDYKKAVSWIRNHKVSLFSYVWT